MNNNDKILLKNQQKILGWLCILLPILCIGFGLFGQFAGVNHPNWFHSISATYHANSKLFMISLLCMTAVYFWAYSGYDKIDNILTCISAICAFGVAAFPTGGGTNENIIGLFCLNSSISSIFHCIFAGVLYASFIVQMLRFRKHGNKMTEKKKLRNKVYLICAIIMICAILCFALVDPLGLPGYGIIISECFLQFGYGFSWLIKAGCIKYLND